MALKTNVETGQYEFRFTQEDFETLRSIVTTNTGIELPDNKKTLMYTRLVRRLRMLSMNDFSSYIQHIKQQVDGGNLHEMMEVVGAMTTNVTSFFREHHHFEHLREILPQIYEKFGEVYLWSSASSSGEEPWSIAMVVHEFMQKNNIKKGVQIYATDIDSEMIEKGRKGLYSLHPQSVNENKYLKTYLKPIGPIREAKLKGHEPTQDFRVCDSIRSLVKFKKTNLLEPWGLPQKHIQIVFCRNVIIYFSKDTQRKIFHRMANIMPQGSTLFIGHSESLMGVSTDYQAVGKTTYERL